MNRINALSRLCDLVDSDIVAFHRPLVSFLVTFVPIVLLNELSSGEVTEHLLFWPVLTLSAAWLLFTLWRYIRYELGTLRDLQEQADEEAKLDSSTD